MLKKILPSSSCTIVDSLIFQFSVIFVDVCFIDYLDMKEREFKPFRIVNLNLNQ